MSEVRLDPKGSWKLHGPDKHKSTDEQTGTAVRGLWDER